MAEIADLLGVSKQVVANWRSRKEDFPSPRQTLRSGPIWALDDIVAWAESEGIDVHLDTVAREENDDIARPAVIAAVMNMKGGVGKSTVSANVGWYAAVMRNLRVLLVDLDPQFNLSQYVLGAERYQKLLESGEPRIDALFPAPGFSPTPIRKLIRKVQEWDDGSCLHLVPASLELAWNMRLATERAHVLRDALENVRDDYDLILIDCAPTESILSTATYLASDWIVVPVKPEYLSAIGVPLLLKSLKAFGETHSNEKVPDVAGILFNDVRDRVEHNRARRFVRDQAELNDLPIFTHALSHSDSYPAGARQGKPIFWTDNARTVRKDELGEVGKEFLSRIGL
ncbi:ParA family protein [Brevundimonas sp. Root1279]|uniref:ParA family protein n=1 Tax=Brevundimonas sp. Root1279 TaxID=1736443 RepID=UPI00138EFCA6|nr:ParA family protein [Brevundimonas sp. Root1279]